MRIVAALALRDGRLLLVQQQGPDDPEPQWMLPGGRVEPDEDDLSALRRELQEETRCTLTGEPVEAFLAQVPGGEAITFACEAAGDLSPSDPDGFIRAAEWIAIDESLARLAAVDWYDIQPLQLAAGTNPKIVSEVLGHKEVAITLDRYSHALPTMQADAMDRLDAVLGRTPTSSRAKGPDQGSASGLWLDTGPDKGPERRSRAAKRPDPSVDRAEEGELGTAYRIRGEPPVESD